MERVARTPLGDSGEVVGDGVEVGVPLGDAVSDMDTEIVRVFVGVEPEVSDEEGDAE